MKRHSFTHDGLELSFLDAGGEGAPVIALHAHWMEALTFVPVAAQVRPEWRVIALDQRGHGHSGHPPRRGGYTREAYVGDVAELLDHLRIERAVLLGHSLGGVNAYQFAARYPDRTRALVIEDIGAVVDDDTSFAREWHGTFPTRDALAERVGPRLARYLQDSFRETPHGWRLAFEPEDMIESQRALNGDHWEDWLASRCPALLLRGDGSRVTRAEHFAEMARRREHTRLVTLHGGHVLHVDAAKAYVHEVREFLGALD